jgi:hypothetical protein
MIALRRRLVAIVFAVAASLLAGLVATPAAICQMGAGMARAEMVCTCGHGADAQCPMHPQHGKAGKSSSSNNSRWCAACPDSVEMTMTALVAFAAPIVDRYQAVVPDGTSESLPLFGLHPLDGIRPPFSPPPRG